MNKTPEQVALLLANIYEDEFGGKRRGRFKITRSSLRRLAGRKRLEDSTINRIMGAALEIGYILVDLGDNLAVVEESVMLNYRPVPKSVLSRHSIENDDATGEEDDDDDNDLLSE